jgi:hypothetical protein
MPNPSNLYAEKIFAEHPLALWSLDEKVDYLSKITNTNRDMSSWETTELSTTDFETSSPSSEELVGDPFPEITANKVEAVRIGTAVINQKMSLAPDLSIANSAFSPEMQTVTVSFYTKALHSSTTGVEIGYYKVTGTDPEDIEFGASQSFSAPIPNEWSMYSATFDLPFDGSGFRPFLSFSYTDQEAIGGSDPGNGYSYVVTGLTVGQWSEEFSATSLGVLIDQNNYFKNEAGNQLDPSTLMAEAYFPAYQYGMGTNDAKYIVSNNRLLAKNTSLPMVYGSSGLTKVTANPANIIFTNPPTGVTPIASMAYPSLMFPSLGMLTNAGRYNVYTFETWLRVDNRSYVSRKILGPMFSADGLYVDGPFLKLNIGGNVGSHFVGEWYRPMLVDIRIGIDSASLLVNGEQVLSISFKTSELVFSSVRYSDQWGIFAYPDVPVVEIECPAVYSYLVPAVVAKRRFGYGQAVESPDNVNKSFGAVTAFVDYSVADYTNNYQYPDIGKWGQGIAENVNTQNNTLSSPKYELPEFVFSDSDYDTWFEDQSSNTSEFFTFSDTPGFIRFNNLTVTNQPTKGIYTIVELSSFPTSEQNLIKVVDKLSGDYIRFAIVSDTIKCYIKTRGTETLFSEQGGVVVNEKMFVGMSFDQLALEFGGDVQAFLSKSNQFSMLVAGDNTFSNMFLGKIYKVGICTQRNLNKILNAFNILNLGNIDSGSPSTILWVYSLDGGTPESFDTELIYGHIATYTLRSSIRYNSYSIDVASDSYWQDYLPLSYFAQYVTNIFGEPYIDLDLIQFNIDYPVIPVYNGTSYDTSNAIVKTYVSFQLLAEGATKSLEAFTNILEAPENNVISIEDSSWMDTAYELVDGTVIYPPKDLPINSLAIVTHIELQASNAIQDAVNIKKMEYSSQAFNSDTANPIGTKFNVSVYPYQKYASLFEYKSRNPYRIYKGSTPHLYLTKKTGLQKLGDYDPLISRGFLIPINDKFAESYRVMAAQMFVYYGSDKFPAGEVKVFELQSENQYIKVYMRPVDSSRKRALLYAVNAKTGALYDGIAFYINGKIVKDPVITINEWAVVGIRFANPMIFDNAVGAIRFTGPLLVNNISYYESSGLQEVERQSFRLWDAIASGTNDWAFWSELLNRFGETYLWQDVLVVASTRYSGINPTDIYNAYAGTSKIIGDDGAVFYIGGTKFSSISDISWSTSTTKPL